MSFLATVGSVGALRRPVRHGLGHHAQLHRIAGCAEHQPRRGGAGHRRGAVRHRLGLVAAIPAVDRLQQVLARIAALDGRLEGFADEFARASCRAQLESGGRRWRWRASRQSHAAAAGAAARQPMAEINVTPMVDVMLVLLIIFMVTAPLLTAGVPVDLPKTAAPSLPARRTGRLFISIDTQNRIYVEETQQLVTSGALLRAITENNPDARVLVRGDANRIPGTMTSGHGHHQPPRFTKVAVASRRNPKPRHQITACATA